MKQLDRLIEIIKDVAKGRYSNEVMDLSAPNVEEPVRTIAEAMGLMMVKVEAREFHLEMLIKQPEEVPGSGSWPYDQVESISKMRLNARCRFKHMLEGF